jgi:hypothetical protein
MQPSNHRLLGFVLRARAAGRRRSIAVALADLGLTGASLALLGLVVTTFSLRGDLAAAGIALAFALTLGGSSYRIWRAFTARFRDPISTARVIARTRGVLSPRGSVEVDGVLRHEILGATQLLEGLVDDGARGRQHQGSKGLANQYVASIGERVASRDPGYAVPRPRWRSRLLAFAAVVAAAAGTVTLPGIDVGAGLLLSASDGRPPTPPQPVWSSLDLTIRYPAHTTRPTRKVPNPSGALRVPAGTEIDLAMQATAEAEHVRVVVNYDAAELHQAPPPELFDLTPDEEVEHGWNGTFTVRGGGTWTIVLLDDEDDDDPRRSPPLALELEPDLPPEVELLPLPPNQREPSELGRVDIRFTARDDFGLLRATLAYQVEDGELHRLPAGEAPAGSRQWRRRYTWDLSTIPIEQRSEVTYWIEVRDNDPGLGLDPLSDPPGKVAASARQRLSVRDRESEHARNVQTLRELRDQAVDLLARRLTTTAFSPGDIEQALIGLQTAREIHAQAQTLLAALATLIDDLSVDTMVREREVGSLIEVHERLLEVHRKEQKIHAQMPPEAEARRPQKVAPLLRKLDGHNRKEVAQLEDEIIRLDDLVDTQIIERLERLLDRAETTLSKLMELIQQYEAGDESVRPQIEQLEQRLREDLRRISEARSLLRKELGSEFMNLDALRRLEEQLRGANLGQMLDQPGGAMQRAQELRDELDRMRGQVQGRAAENPQMSEEDRQRMQLLRELGRLKDEQKTLQGETRQLHQAWREAVADQDAEGTAKDAEAARKLREELEKINDARLGREARRGWEDAREELQKLEAMKDEPGAKALELYEAAQRAVDGLDEAVKGSKADEKEGKAVRRLQRRAEGLRNELLGKLPRPKDALEGAQLERFEGLQRQQQGLRRRADALLRDRMANILPQPGRQAMRSADRGMQNSAESLGETDGGGSMQGQQRSVEGIQRAIDSLREQAPPPPTGGTSGEASTEAERDKSWRDQLMDAMREQAPDGFHDEVERYYEELLK